MLALAAQATTFRITDTKLYVPVVTLSTQDNAKLFEQLKAGFRRTINWNKYQSENVIQAQNPYFDYLTTQVLKKLKECMLPCHVSASE